MIATAPKTKLKLAPVNREIRTAGELKIHPLAELPPPMKEADFDALQEDIVRSRRVRRTIVLLDGAILDGRHRYRIARKHGLPFKTREFDRATEGDPLDFVYGRLLGRQLDGSQKAAAAVDFLEAKEAQPAPLDGQRRREWAGDLFGVSGRYIQRAKALKSVNLALFARVKAGITPLPIAEREQQRATKIVALTKASDIARKAIGKSGSAFELFTGDALKILPTLDVTASLIFTDPKYNLGFDYGDGPRADSMPEEDYRRWCRTWMGMLYDKLANNGSIFVMIDAKHQAEFHTMLSDLGLHWRNTIVWFETFGNYTPDNFTPCARYIHYFTRSAKRFTWNPEAILIPSDRQTKYNDPRAVETGKVPGNVWQIPRLVGNAKEVLPGFANQLPVELIDRIIRVASEPGDLVLDPFNGSGTTGAAALPLLRRYCGIDIVKRNVQWSRNRLTTIAADVGKQ